MTVSEVVEVEGHIIDSLILVNKGAWEKLQQAMAPFRPGGTPLRLDLLTPGGARGTVDLNGQNSLRTDAELLNLLRALPGVSGVSLALHRPWAS